MDCPRSREPFRPIFAFQPTYNDAPVTIRSTMIDGEPWFVAPDVGRCLMLDDKGGRARHLRRLSQTVSEFQKLIAHIKTAGDTLERVAPNEVRV